MRQPMQVVDLSTEYRILGPLEVIRDGHRIPLPGGHGCSLLAILVLHVGEVISADRLIDHIWGESPPATADKALQGLISTLRRRLEPGWDGRESPCVLLTEGGGYVLAVDVDQVDAHRFRRLVTLASNTEPRTAAAVLQEALAMWRGRALDDFTYEPFAQSAIAELTELRLSALQARIGADLRLGRHDEVLAELKGLVADYPLRERFASMLMLALYRCGRQADALAQYQRTRNLMIDELGLEPSPELQDLERGILTQDSRLAAPARMSRPPTEDMALAGIVSGRKVVTVLFADLAAPTHADAADPERLRGETRRTNELASRIVEGHGGVVEGLLGGVLVAVFGLPIAHEDDATRAVHAAVALSEQLPTATGRVPRVGIETGEVVVNDPAHVGAGSAPPAAVAAQLQQSAQPGEIVLGDSTRALARSLVTAERIGEDAPGWRLIAVSDAHGEPPAGTDPALVGRDRELHQLRAALDASIASGRSNLVQILGDAGVGKSHLVRAFAAHPGSSAVVVHGRCPAYGEGMTLWPLREIVDALAELDLATDDAVAAVGLTNDSAFPTEWFLAVRRTLESASMSRPVVVVFDDLHWAQPALLDLIDHLTAVTTGPLMIVGMARPDLAEARPDWVRREGNARLVLRLLPLDRDDAEELISQRCRGQPLRADQRTRILDFAQGNPLFLEQLLAAAREGTELGLPPSVRALLAARLDRLGPAQLDVLRCASILGTEFDVEALRSLVPVAVAAHLDRHLGDLEARQMLQRTPDPSRRSFAHQLVQLTAYASVTLEARAHLHQRSAHWFTDHTGSRPALADELVGHHLEQTCMRWSELGRTGEDVAAIALEAAERLARAAFRAADRLDVPATENLCTRVRALLPSDHHLARTALRRLSECYPNLGRPAEAEAAFAELLATASHHADERETREIQLELARFRMITGPDPATLAEIRSTASASYEADRRDSHLAGMAQAHYVLSFVHLRAGNMAELEASARAGWDLAKKAGTRRERVGAAWWIVHSALAGPAPVEATMRACKEVLHSDEIEHPAALAALGYLSAATGDVDTGREQVARALRMVREHFRLPRPETFIAQQAARVEMLAGDLAAAERALTSGLHVALDMAARDDAAQIAGRLSLLCSTQGRQDEAAGHAATAIERSPAESVTARALADAATAHAQRVTGTSDSAVRLGRSAVERVPHDMLSLRAELTLNYLRLLEPNSAAAANACRNAIELFDAKGETHWRTTL